MFQEACARNRNAIYGIVGSSPNFRSNGTGFMITPGIIATAAHVVHDQSNPPVVLASFGVIRAPDIGQSMELATLIVEDPQRDVAFLRVENPRSKEYLNLESTRVPVGTFCGSLGFPFAEITQNPANPQAFTYLATERFQGSHVSSFGPPTTTPQVPFHFYETDSLMYPGSSGCPVFLMNSNVIGMQVGSRIEAGTRVAVSLLVPSMDIIAFAQRNGIL